MATLTLPAIPDQELAIYPFVAAVITSSEQEPLGKVVVTTDTTPKIIDGPKKARIQVLQFNISRLQKDVDVPILTLGAGEVLIDRVIHRKTPEVTSQGTMYSVAGQITVLVNNPQVAPVHPLLQNEVNLKGLL